MAEAERVLSRNKMKTLTDLILVEAAALPSLYLQVWGRVCPSLASDSLDVLWAPLE